ncbi:MAG: type secretion protein family, partial [Proteobacteria bacterium]|nr:type secretion protein family [Pseudomonadota bacterium]
MAGTDRTAAHDLIEALRVEPYRFDFFQAMRLIECAHGDKPRLGTSSRAAEDPVRLGQEPNMQFAPAALSGLVPGREGLPDRLEVRFCGLFGPNGPLPSHLTEYATERTRHHGDPTFSRFADIFHHRMLCLFYRAWANGEPTVHFDRPDDDRYTDYLGALFGIGMDALHQRDAMPDPAKLFFAGLLACQTRHPDGLAAILREFFGIPASVLEFVGEWMPIARSDQTRLGTSEPSGAL